METPNDILLLAIERAADALVDLMREAEARGLQRLRQEAGQCYANVLDLRLPVQEDSK